MANVLLAIPMLPGCLDALDAHLVISGPPGSDTRAEALICGPMQTVDETSLTQMPALRVVAVAGAGSDAVDVQALAARHIALVTAGDVLAEATADLAFGLIIGASRLMWDAGTTLRAGEWQGWQFVEEYGRDVHGATLGLIGFGPIGRAVALRARGFEMNILHHTRHPTEHPGWIEDLDDLLRESDIVSVHVPLSDSTRNLLDRRRLGLLKPSAVLINTARGAIVDEDGLADALCTGRLFAAGLDVYVNEPQVSPRLLNAPRTLLLPHMGSSTRRTREAMIRSAAEKVRDFFMEASPGPD